jgi:lipopolysaccharide heptosyltransferase II
MSDQLEIPKGARIVVSRTDRIGDLLLALPLAESIKLRHPDCEVHVMASLYASPVVEHNPNIDGIVRVQLDQLIGNGRYRVELQAKVAKLGFHTAVVLYPEPHVCRMLHRVGVPHRIGTSRRFHSLYFNHHIHHSRKTNRKHELDYNLDFLRFFADGATVSRPRVCLIDRDKQGSVRLLESRSILGDFMVIHPGSGGSADRWPLENFLRLADLIMKQGVQVVVTGSVSEAPVIERTAAHLGIRVPTIGGDTDLRTLSAVLASARLVVSNSTGPLHLAAAVGTPVVGLYPSKRMMSPVRWGPVGEEHLVLQPSAAVCRCPEKRCECMRSMSVETVFAGVSKALAARHSSKSVVS